MISVTIAVIVLAIIGNILIYTAKDNIDISRINKLKNDIELLETKISTFYIDNDKIPVLCKIESTQDIPLAENDLGDFYVIDLERLDSLTLNYGKGYYKIKENYSNLTLVDDIYIINEVSHNVYYRKGINVEGKESKLYRANSDEQYEKVELDTYSMDNFCSKPLISDGMIPIKHNGTNWVVCSEDDPEWYNYEEQESTTEEGGTSKWANIMLSDGIYKEGSVAVGTEIAQNDLGSIFVWIPRYAYSITKGYHSNQEGNIDIKFIGTNIKDAGDIIKSHLTLQKDIVIDNEQGEDKWNIPTAFKYEDRELSGFYVAKFQASKNNDKITVKANASPWRSMTISNMLTTCINMNNSTNAANYGINSNDEIIDPHMLKNSEWGAVAYLAHSEYGRNGTEVRINNNSNFITGIGAEISSAGETESTTHSYNTQIGKLASTTGNITGVYDMSGAAYEFVAAYVDGEIDDSYAALVNADSKYKDVYSSNYDLNLDIYADAVYETSNLDSEVNSWNGDSSTFPGISSEKHEPFFERGSCFEGTSNAGIFAFTSGNGRASSDFAFRPSIALVNNK